MCTAGTSFSETEEIKLIRYLTNIVIVKCVCIVQVCVHCASSTFMRSDNKD